MIFQNCRMEAYVPATMVDRMLRIVEVGKIYLIVNFEVKDYMEKDKFRPVQMDKKIVCYLLIIVILNLNIYNLLTEEVDICNYSPTKFYLNYEHHSVNSLRKL